MERPMVNGARSMRSTVSKGTDRVMLMNADRVLYYGLLGTRSVSIQGSLTVYVAFAQPFLIRIDQGPWQETRCEAVPPYVPHQITSPERMIGILNIEPEFVDCGALPWLGCTADRGNAIDSLAERIRSLYARLTQEGSHDVAWPFDLDEAMFGGPLPLRRFDPRIESTVARIKANPCDQFSAEDCASDLGLSFSRFLHLFSDEVGTTFRRFRAWKRARSLLQYVNRSVSLTDIALEVGYTDSSHFSHSIRQVYGLKPKDIFAGSRRLAVLA